MSAEFPVRAKLDPKGIDQLITALMKAGKQANLTEDEIEDITKEVKNLGHESDRSIGNINKSLNNMVDTGLKRVGAAFIAAFAVDRLLNLGKEIIKITAEFQKMEAVLTTSLGSKSAARIAMAELEKFAAATPFSVQELTASYVKLVNQGFKPTVEELRKLGDLSASTGKDFDQLTEAIIDAQTGEFERLKEFGIRASKAGDQVTFTFKGVETQTKFTAEAIREYVLALGDAEGVSGSMANISATLGGQISNLGDSWDKFLKTLGDGKKGPLSNAIRNLNILLSLATDFVKTDAQKLEEVTVETTAAAVENVKKMAETYEGDLNKAAEDYIALLNQQIADVRTLQKAVNYLDENKSDEENEKEAEKYNTLEDQAIVLWEQVKAIQEYVANQEKSKKAGKEIVQLTKEQLEEIRMLREMEDRHRGQEALKKMREQWKKEFDERKIGLKGALDSEGEAREAFERFIAEKEKDIRVKNAAAIAEQLDAIEEERFEKEAERMKRREELWQFGFNAGMTIAGAFFDYQDALDQRALERSQSQRDYELSLAGENADAKKRINKKYDDEQRAIKARQARGDRDQAMFNIAISTAQGVMAALASIPPNVPLSFAIGALGLAQEIFVAAKPLPKFKDGVFDLQGPGTETSDDILARLSRRETVVPAHGTKRFPSLLKRVVEDPKATWMDLKDIVDANIPSHLRGDLFHGKVATDSEETLRELREIKDAILNKKELHLGISEKGFQKWTRSGDNWSRIEDERYRF